MKSELTADPRHCRPQLAQSGLVFQRGVVALHRRQNAVRARLHRHLPVFDQLRHFGVSLDQAVGELERVRGGVTNAVDTVDCGNDADQIGQVPSWVVPR